ncbi:MAG: ribose 5-phosphate isomerase B [Acidobacteriia bacterium]|nr:ribose 5-phosphate isomerase B [Terriglobia bacterium]
MKIAVASDHVGWALKAKVGDYLRSKGFDVEDYGPTTPESVDYPDYAEKVAVSVAAKGADFGVLVCGTGLGVAIAANKVPGIRAATCNDTISAYFARAHNDANVLALGGRLADEATARKIVDVWLSTEFEGGRHARRVEKIAHIDTRNHTERSR